MKTKLTVAVDAKGNVVGTHAPNRNPQNVPFYIESGLLALPGQTLHQIEFDVPESFTHEKDVADFHQRVRDHIEKGLKSSSK